MVSESISSDACCPSSAALPLGHAEAEGFAAVLKALGDPVRLRMISMVAAAPELCVCDISPAFDLSSATISHHLRTLREADLLNHDRRGTYVYYRINPKHRALIDNLLIAATSASQVEDEGGRRN